MADIAPIIMTASMGPADQAWADRLRAAHFPPERNFLSAHITLFHHLPPALLPEIKARLAAITANRGPPRALLSGIIGLGRGVAYRIDSADLSSIRDELAFAFHGLLTPQDQARPRFHITVQNKVDPPIAKALQRKLEAAFEPRPLSIAGLAAHYYRGGPWEDIGHWPFRGNNA